MHYTEEQKTKLYDALLPHVFVQGGALIVNQEGRVTKELAKYVKGNLIVPVGLLAPEHGNALKHLLKEYLTIENFPDIVDNRMATVVRTLRSQAQIMARKYLHGSTPYSLTEKMSERREAMARTLVRACPEEVELLHYQR